MTTLRLFIHINMKRDLMPGRVEKSVGRLATNREVGIATITNVSLLNNKTGLRKSIRKAFCSVKPVVASLLCRGRFSLTLKEAYR
jgi:hypothetical protein